MGIKSLYLLLNASVGLTWNSFVLFGISMLALLVGALFAARARQGLWREVRSGYALVFCLSVLVSVANVVVLGVPVPRVSDEFSYLFGADTFAHFRLTNPSPPSPKHFETYHVLVEPVFVTKYPPLLLLGLVVGQLTTGYPIVGVFLFLGLACVSVTWLLRQYLDPRWALLGGLLLAVHPLFVYWGRSYWGGQLAVIGGALVLGALAPLVRTPGPWSAAVLRRAGLLFGGGLFILAGTRPFEGVVLGVSVGLVALGALGRSGTLRGIGAIFVGASGPLVLLALWTLGYNRAVTGNPLELPYQRHVRLYEAEAIFTWQALPPMPRYHHADMEACYRQQRETQLRWAADPALRRVHVFSQLLGGSCLYVFSAGLLFGAVLGLSTRDSGWRWRALLAALAALNLLGAIQSNFMSAHYTAPAVGLNLLLALEGWRAWAEKRGVLPGRVALGLLVYGIVLLGGDFAFRVYTQKRQGPDFALQRAALQRQVEQTPEGGVILVRYYPGHSPDEEWVYNAASWQTAKVLWVRDCGEAENRALLRHFPGKRVYRVHALAQGKSWWEELRGSRD